MYCWLYALLLAASIQPYGPSTTALQSYKDKGLAGTLMASTVPLVGRVVTDSLEKSPVKGLADTLITSSVPLVGRVTADTLIASHVPLVGRVTVLTDFHEESLVRGIDGTLSISQSILHILTQESY